GVGHRGLGRRRMGARRFDPRRNRGLILIAVIGRDRRVTFAVGLPTLIFVALFAALVFARVLTADVAVMLATTPAAASTTTSAPAAASAVFTRLTVMSQLLLVL